MCAILSYRLARRDNRTEIFLIDSIFIEALSNEKLPNPMWQLQNLITLVGDYFEARGKNLPDEKRVSAQIGSINRRSADRIIDQAKERSIINVYGPYDADSRREIELSFRGWQIYEKQKKGSLSNKSVFLAMAFRNQELTRIVNEKLRPAFSTELGLNLLRLDDVERAGIIDNIMRVQIRNSTVLISDLTDGNNGAYWEAGYAEGLGKPVLYICEEKVFNENKTHFDTNHCTTVVWNADINQNDKFVKRMIATVKRSLD
ncbi:MAG: hypothetical protein ACFB2Z_03010 [Maricaulaceae bacterium]